MVMTKNTGVPIRACPEYIDTENPESRSELHPKMLIKEDMRLSQN